MTLHEKSVYHQVHILAWLPRRKLCHPGRKPEHLNAGMGLPCVTLEINALQILIVNLVQNIMTRMLQLCAPILRESLFLQSDHPQVLQWCSRDGSYCSDAW